MKLRVTLEQERPADRFGLGRVKGGTSNHREGWLLLQHKLPAAERPRRRGGMTRQAPLPERRRLSEASSDKEGSRVGENKVPGGLGLHCHSQIVCTPRRHADWSSRATVGGVNRTKTPRPARRDHPPEAEAVQLTFWRQAGNDSSRGMGHGRVRTSLEEADQRGPRPPGRLGAEKRTTTTT